MKITTWNVNGLRAALKKGLLDWARLHTDDVLCLQEIRSRPEQIEPVYRAGLSAAYPHITWNPAERAGYSGVATLLGPQTAPQLVETRLGLDAPLFDVEGRVIITRFPDFWLFNIYFPNGGRSLERVPFKLDFYAHLLAYCDELHTRGQQVILCGDFNTCHLPIDLRNAKQNETNTGFLPEERAWIDRYLAHGFVDIYRRLYPQRVQYTWWTYRMNARERGVGWRLDYFLVSAGLVERVQDVIIHEQTPGSDHCPVTLQMLG